MCAVYYRLRALQTLRLVAAVGPLQAEHAVDWRMSRNLFGFGLIGPACKEQVSINKTVVEAESWTDGGKHITKRESQTGLL
jgi:hypothetical protein